MTIYTDLISDVMTVTKRPDLIDETALAVRTATLKAHQSDFYPKDIFETGISWDDPAFFQSLDYRALIPRWRAFKYLRKYSSGVAGTFFTLLTPEQTLDGYNINRENICYLAGEMLEMRSDSEDTYMILACYRNPALGAGNYDSWIALDHPYAIVYEAARLIFKQTGWDEQAAAIKQEVAEQYQLLKQEVTAYGE